MRADGSVEPVELDRAATRRLYATALAAARDSGLNLETKPLRLGPQDKLVKIVAESQRLALEGEGGEADADAEG